MFTAEELNSWNELFPDAKMSESQLAQPKEQFLTKVLVAYVRKFGYKIVLPLNMDTNDNSREKRLFLIKLARQTEQILQITDKSYTFTYYDLIHPTPKKTSHMLSILLNYLYYYNMYKTEVLNIANEKIKQLQELQQIVSTATQENEQLKLKEKKIKEETAKFKSILPNMKSMLEGLKEQNYTRETELQKLQVTFQETCTLLDELKSHKRSTEKQIVCDKEAVELKTCVARLEEHIADRKRLEANAEGIIKERSENITIFNEFMKKIEEAQEVFPLTLWEKCKEISKHLSETKCEFEIAQTKKEGLMQMIEKQQQVLRSFEEKLKIKQEQFEQEKTDKSSECATKEKERVHNNKSLGYLVGREHAMNCLIEEQKEIYDYLQQNINVILPDSCLNSFNVTKII